MKKWMAMAPLALMLVACGDDNAKQDTAPEEVAQGSIETNEELALSKAEQEPWEVDSRLGEPTEDTVCHMCNMKVHTKDDAMGVFAAQAVLPDGSVVFYDDIGCLLNDEHVSGEKHEKFVRDYETLLWFNVEEAYVVKTTLKSPMNWGYIFFKYEEDALAYVAANEGAAITPLDQVREEGIERHQQSGGHGHSHGAGSDDGHGHDDAEGEGHNDGHSHDDAEGEEHNDGHSHDDAEGEDHSDDASDEGHGH